MTDRLREALRLIHNGSQRPIQRCLHCQAENRIRERLRHYGRRGFFDGTAVGLTAQDLFHCTGRALWFCCDACYLSHSAMTESEECES